MFSLCCCQIICTCLYAQNVDEGNHNNYRGQRGQTPSSMKKKDLGNHFVALLPIINEIF